MFSNICVIFACGLGITIAFPKVPLKKLVDLVEVEPSLPVPDTYPMTFPFPIFPQNFGEVKFDEEEINLPVSNLGLPSLTSITKFHPSDFRDSRERLPEQPARDLSEVTNHIKEHAEPSLSSSQSICSYSEETSSNPHLLQCLWKSEVLPEPVQKEPLAMSSDYDQPSVLNNRLFNSILDSEKPSEKTICSEPTAGLDPKLLQRIVESPDLTELIMKSFPLENASSSSRSWNADESLKESSEKIFPKQSLGSPDHGETSYPVFLSRKY